MKTSHILLLCILGAALVSTVLCDNSVGPDVCCFTFYPRRLKKSSIRSYNMTNQHCSRTGAIFVTLRNNEICVDPNLSWVQGIMKSLDEQFL